MRILVFTAILLFNLFSFAQNQEEIILNWSSEAAVEINGGLSYKVPIFKNNSFDIDIDNRLIFFKKNIITNSKIDKNSFRFDVEYESIVESALFDLDKRNIKSDVNLHLSESFLAKDQFVTTLTFSPIIYVNGAYKRVKKISYNYNLDIASRSSNYVTNALQNSVFSSGSWHRFYVERSGVYRVSKAFLESLGVNTNVDPRTIKIFGNGGKMLPLENFTSFLMDVEENAIQFIGEEDGVFDNQDYILFYAEGVDQWNEESLTSKNLYSDRSYYYVTSGGNNGRRIEEAVQPSTSPDLVFNQFDAQVIYEEDLINVAKVGRRWFGKQFNIEENQNFVLQVPNLDTTSPVDVKINFASKSLNITSFSTSVNGQSIGVVNFPSLPAGSGFEAYESALNTSFTSSSTALNFTIVYDNGGLPSSNGYLDFIKVNAKCNLVANGNQFEFRNNEQATNIGVGQYNVSNASSVSQIWDVTDIFNVKKYSNTGNSTFSFKVSLGDNAKYVVVENNDFLVPLRESNSTVQNQNLKGTIFLNNSGSFEDVDYLIFTPDYLKSAAERLANFHRTNSGFNTKVVTLENVYQEFGSGKQDIAAIRNFIRYVYQNASSASNRVKYVNLFGDASYDYKNRIPNNSNVVPIFHGFNPNASETNNTSNMSLIATFMSDDFYGLMDDGEGKMLPSEPDGIDIAVGRMLVNDLIQANEMVTKVIEYHDEKAYGRWRNTYTIYSDDADTSSDAILQVYIDNIANQLTAQKPFVNVKKIHTDAYVQEVSAGGERYPEAKEDFLNAIQQGSLVVNYFGHGNEEFLGRERLFERLDAQNLENQFRYPLFVTITCDFTRFDDPNRITGGEFMYWNDKGGAIALVATTREIFVNTGVTLNTLLTQYLYAYGSYDYPTIAEALRLAKILSGSSNRRVVSFIGDPAMFLAIPKPRVLLTEVNDVPVGSALPVFRALDFMKIEGQVVDESNVLMTDYNGDVAIQIFDKNINRATLGNNGVVDGLGQLILMNYITLGETIVRGNASVNNGSFEFSFVVPQDIRIPVDNGKISFYSKRTNPLLENQTGYNLDIEIGGVNTSAPTDSAPPRIQLYMNDESFVSGEITNCSPILLAYVQDENGINTASGIGHDIVAILDGDESNPYILNDYYETELDDYTRGVVRFAFRDLEPGMHTILFKVWDVYNNLSTMEIQFNAICSDDGLKIDKVLNYPNPFVSYTEFWFTHNMPFEPLDVQVQIFTITGKVVKTINQQVVTDGFLSREVKWDGRDDFGDKIGKGVYVYKLSVKSLNTGKTMEKHEKLVIL